MAGCTRTLTFPSGRLLAMASSFEAVLVAAALVGTGSSIFHPESSRVARMASGGRHGLAQSIFQVGGNFGSSLGPLLAAVIIAPYGKGNVAWFVLAEPVPLDEILDAARAVAREERQAQAKAQSPEQAVAAARLQRRHRAGTDGQVVTGH